MKKIKVLVADDSALMRNLLTEIINQDPELTVVAAVSDAYRAREEIKRLNPDVLTLDIEMPKMDGISFLEKLMRLRPMPVVMISAMTEKGADVTMKALMLGAVDFVTKPKVDIANSLNQYAETIRSKLKAAASSKIARINHEKDEAGLSRSDRDQARKEFHVITIGASTGGVEAIHSLLSKLPANLPPMLITQHIPPVFSASFARRLNDELSMNVYEAHDGQVIEHGNVYIAPGDQHLKLVKEGGKYRCALDDGDPVNRHKPSVDVLFDSVVKATSGKAVGVLLTGMGGDGAKGLLNLRNKGAVTITQDRESSIVWGMPREAVEIGAAQHVLPLNLISGKLINLCSKDKKIGESSASY